MGFMLDCPHCGTRSYHEFSFGGELRPWKEDPTVAEEYDTTWLRSNIAGHQLKTWARSNGVQRCLAKKQRVQDAYPISPIEEQWHKLRSEVASASYD